MNRPLETPPAFDQSLQAAIHRVTCDLVSAAVGGADAPAAAPLPVEAAQVAVSGLFVTLKRDGKLRSCFGAYGGSMRLDAALSRAAHGAATSDPRFPSIEPEEVSKLHLEISLLFALQAITAEGEQRVAEVEIGTHGLEISYAGRRGLLLPRVAVDFQLDSLGFLRQVCQKAGLQLDAWIEPDAKLSRFQSYCFGGLVADTGQS